MLIGGGLEPDEAPIDDFAQRHGVAYDQIPEMRRALDPRNDAIALVKLVARIRELRPDIVHTHTAKAGALGRIAARIARVPLVVHTFHGHVFDGYFSRKRARFFKRTERGLARLSDAIVAISERQREDLVTHYRIAPREKVHVVPLGLDLDRFLAVERGSVSFREELEIGSAPLVVSVGRLVPIKRFDLMIDAFDELRKVRPEAHLAIAGDGEEHAKLSARAATSRHVHLVGLRRDLERIYGSANLFVLSSDNEGTPVAAIEALASGLRVVATDVGGIGDFLSPDLGLRVPRGDAKQLAMAMLAGLEGPAPGPEGRARIAAKFSHLRLIEDITELYDGLFERRPLRRTPISGSSA